MKSSSKTSALPGVFYSGHVAATPDAPRRQRRRVLCYVTPNDTVGASLYFHKTEAVENATKAERGELTLKNVHSVNPAKLLTTVLFARGFPVRGANDCIDDVTASYLEREFKQVA